MGIDIGSILGGTIGETFAKIVSCFKVSPDKALEAQTELAKIQGELQSKLQDAVSAEINAAAGNIQADAKSGDKFTQRARPSFMYVVETILICNYILIPLFGLHSGEPLTLPDPLFWLFGSAILGYTGARTWEKFNLDK
jgi:hypothetical protein